MKRIGLVFVFLSLLGCEQSANGVFQNVSSSVPVSNIRWISFVPFLKESPADKRVVALSHKGVHIIGDENKGTKDNGSIMYEKANITNENKLPYNQSRVVLIPNNYSSEKKIIVHTVTSELEDNGGFYITEISDIDLNKKVNELKKYSLDENTIIKLVSYDETILKYNADEEVKPSRVLAEVPNTNGVKKYAIGTLELTASEKIKFIPIATIDDFMKIDSGKFTGIFKYENYSKWSISDPNTIRPARFWTSLDASVVVFMDSCGLYYYAYRQTDTSDSYTVSEILTKNDRGQIAKGNQKKRQWLDSNSDSYRMLSFFLPNYKESGVKWIALSRYGYFYHSDCADDFRTGDGRFSIDPTTPVISLVRDEWENGEVDKKITLFARYIGYGYVVARIHTTLNEKNKLIQDSSDSIEYQSSGFAEKFRTSTITDIVHIDLKDDQKRHKLIVGTAKGGVGVYTISNIDDDEDFSPKNVCDSSLGFKNESFNVIEVFN